MDTAAYDDLPDPITDLSMYDSDGEDMGGDDVNGGTDKVSGTDHVGLPPLVQQNEEEDAEDIDENGYDEELPDMKSVLAELKNICDEEGVPYTGPMESMMKAKIGKESIYLSSLVWFVRGVSLANQTQVIPTIMGAIADMKVETRILGQSAGKMNKEVERAERLAANVSEQLRGVKDEIKTSFRESILSFMKTDKERVSQSSFADRVIPMEDTPIPQVIGKGEDASKGTPNVGQPITVASGKEDDTKTSVMLKRKRATMMKLGFKPVWIDTIGMDILDSIFDDDFHAEVEKAKLSSEGKKAIREELAARVEELIDGTE